MRSIARIADMLDLYAKASRLEQPSPPDVTLFHLFCDLIDYADRHGIDIRAELSTAEQHMREHGADLKG